MRLPIATITLAAVISLLEASGQAAEMKVRAECTPQGSIVTLGDLVDLRCDSTSEAERLAQISLFPAPAPGMRRFVSAREIKDMLLIRGIDLIDHRFRGATTILVIGREPQAEVSPAVKVASASPRLAEKKLEKTVNEYFDRFGDEPWEIEFQLDQDTARWISAAQSLTVQGDPAPSEGRHCFEVTLQVG